MRLVLLPGQCNNPKCGLFPAFVNPEYVIGILSQVGSSGLHEGCPEWVVMLSNDVRIHGEIGPGGIREIVKCLEEA